MGCSGTCARVQRLHGALAGGLGRRALLVETTHRLRLHAGAAARALPIASLLLFSAFCEATSHQSEEHQKAASRAYRRKHFRAAAAFDQGRASHGRRPIKVSQRLIPGLWRAIAVGSGVRGVAESTAATFSPTARRRRALCAVSDVLIVPPSVASGSLGLSGSSRGMSVVKSKDDRPGR